MDVPADMWWFDVFEGSDGIRRAFLRMGLDAYALNRDGIPFVVRSAENAVHLLEEVFTGGIMPKGEYELILQQIPFLRLFAMEEEFRSAAKEGE